MSSPRLPGPPGHWLVGHLPEFGRDLLGFLTSCARQYGDVCAFRLARWPAVLVSDPRLIDDVLVAQCDNFIKHRFFWRHVGAIFGEGLLTSEGDAWRRRRRLAQPAFHRDRLAGYSAIMAEAAEQTAAAWRDGQSLDVHREMMALTMRIVVRTLFGSEVRGEARSIGEAFDVATKEIARRFTWPFRIPDAVPTPSNLRYRRAVGQLDRIVYRFIREAHAPGHDDGRLLSMLLSARDEAGAAMTERQVRDEVVTLFLAGHETTALTLSWTWMLLARHPQVEQTLWAELAAVLGGRTPGVEDLSGLPYTEMIVKEALRLYPPAYVIGREAVEPCRLGSHAIGAGTTIFISPWVLHRDPRFFEDPERFRPERWAGDAARRLPRNVYLPFGGGPRVCIGAGFAMMEATLLLATIAQRWAFRLTPDRRVTLFPSITLRPGNGVWGTVSQRIPDRGQTPSATPTSAGAGTLPAHAGLGTASI